MTVPLAAPVMRQVARMLLPSTSAAMIRVRCSVESLFILAIIRERSGIIKGIGAHSRAGVTGEVAPRNVGPQRVGVLPCAANRLAVGARRGLTAATESPLLCHPAYLGTIRP